MTSLISPTDPYAISLSKSYSQLQNGNIISFIVHLTIVVHLNLTFEIPARDGRYKIHCSNCLIKIILILYYKTIL